MAKVTIIIEDDVRGGKDVVKMNIQRDENAGKVTDPSQPCTASDIVGMGIKRLFDTQAIHKLAINCCPDMMQMNKDHKDKKPKLFKASANDVRNVERSKA